MNLPKPGQVANYQMTDQTELDNLRIISRAGKATGSDKYFIYDVQQGNRPFCLDFENAVTSWTPVSEADSYIIYI